MHIGTLTATALLATAALGSGATLVHSWDFDSALPNVPDSVGGADGTGGANVVPTAGQVGPGAYFEKGDGGGFDADGYVDIAAPVDYSASGDFSFSYWVKLDADASTDARGIFDFSGDGGDGPQSLYIQNGGNAGRMAFRVDGSGATNLVAFADVSALEDGDWFHVAGVFDYNGAGSADLDVYINGAPAANASSSFTPATWSTDQYIGAFNVNGVAANRGLGGGIDEFQIYSDLLTPAEISALAAVPEPSSGALALAAVAGLALRRRRNR